MADTVRDNGTRSRFELVDGETVLGFVTYDVRDEGVAVLHTEVDPALRGRGVGERLAGGTLALLRRRGQKVVPVCPYFGRYLERHPADADLLAGD